MISGEAVELTR